MLVSRGRMKIVKNSSLNSKRFKFLNTSDIDGGMGGGNGSGGDESGRQILVHSLYLDSRTSNWTSVKFGNLKVHDQIPLVPDCP
jgi:hypothetical protein